MILSSLLIAQLAIYQHALSLEAIYGIEAELTLAIIQTESEFNPNAIGSAGEVGLMQLHPKYHKNPKYSSKENMEQGVAYLAKIKAKCFPQLRSAWFICYNTGIRKAKALDKPFQFSYYKKVRKYYAQIAKSLYHARASSSSERQMYIAESSR